MGRVTRPIRSHGLDHLPTVRPSALTAPLRGVDRFVAAVDPVGCGNCDTACELQVRRAARGSSHVSQRRCGDNPACCRDSAYLTLCRAMQLLALLAAATPVGFRNSDVIRNLVVLVNETAESVPAPNAGGDRYRIRPSPNLDTSGRPKREASVRPLVVVVPHVLVENTFKVTSTPDQHPVQALLPHGPHSPLSERVSVRRLDRRLDGLDAIGGEDIVEGTGELAVTVTNEEPRCAGSRCRLSCPAHRELSCSLDHPRPVRMVGDARQANPPGTQLDQEQDV